MQNITPRKIYPMCGLIVNPHKFATQSAHFVAILYPGPLVEFVWHLCTCLLLFTVVCCCLLLGQFIKLNINNFKITNDNLHYNT